MALTISRQQIGERTFPVVEVFGPTIQGEGVDQGKPCYFIRFGGCDYKCEWCDSPHAVLPNLVRHAQRLTANQILDKFQLGARRADWFVLSGGNPCLHELGDLVKLLHNSGCKVALETQGTKWKDWIPLCDRIAVSPKPPSSGETTFIPQLRDFLNRLNSNFTFLKIVVFDANDYYFARDIHRRFPRFPMFLSAGNDAGATVGDPGRKDERSYQQVMMDLVRKGRWLANQVMVDREMAEVRVQMQQHVLFWGNERGR